MGSHVVRTGTAIADATGVATVVVSVDVWLITLTTAVASTSSALQPTARVYNGPASSIVNYLGGTYTGTGDTSESRHLFRPGDQITTVFERCDVGAQCSIRLSCVMCLTEREALLAILGGGLL
jgi:hypothetical protein